jgi:AcrR family transcriptional regulator
MAVLKATRELVDEVGYSHVTIESIAARAGVGKATIYRWWQSKNMILAECVLGGQVFPVAPIGASPDENAMDATEWFREALKFVDENVSLLRGLTAASFEDETIAMQLHLRLMKPVEDALEQWSAKMIPVSDAQGDISANGLAQLIFGAILYRLAPYGASTDDPTEKVFAALLNWTRLIESAPPQRKKAP